MAKPTRLFIGAPPIEIATLHVERHSPPGRRVTRGRTRRGGGTRRSREGRANPTNRLRLVDRTLDPNLDAAVAVVNYPVAGLAESKSLMEALGAGVVLEDIEAGYSRGLVRESAVPR